eukprot:scaffold23058_cov68-Phaeocystis_antarctica.AAC.5
MRQGMRHEEEGPQGQAAGPGRWPHLLACDSAVAVYWEGNRERIVPRLCAQRISATPPGQELEQNEQASGSLGPSVSWAGRLAISDVTCFRHRPQLRWR